MSQSKVVADGAITLSISRYLGVQVVIKRPPAIWHHYELGSLHQEVSVAVVDDIANIIQIGGCVVMGVGVAPEKFRLLLEGVTNQDYLVIGAKDSKDADYLASKLSGELLGPKSISLLGSEMKVYLIKSEKVSS